jgi:hypothetical protein
VVSADEVLTSCLVEVCVRDDRRQCVGSSEFDSVCGTVQTTRS